MRQALFQPAPPKFITLPSIGLDISDTSMKYVKLGGTKVGNRTLDQFGDIDIPGGVLHRGQVEDPQKLAQVLAECKAQTGAEFVRVSLPEERAYLFETELKKSTPLKEMRSLLEFRLAENVPIPARDVFFDYSVLPAGPEDKVLKVAVTAYARETIQTYYEACIAAKLQPVAFEVEAQAMARAVIPDEMEGAAMLVDFGKTRTGIGIVYNKTLLYTSTIDIGGNQLSAALRKQLGDNKAEKELTELKNLEGLVHGANSSVVHDALMTTVSVIKDELATRMQYWHLRTGADADRRIHKIILCGGSSNLKGLPAYLTESIGVTTVRGNVWENTFSLEDTIPPIDKRHSLGYATAVGLALQASV